MRMTSVRMAKGEKIMRLVDADALIKDLKDRKIPFNADINDVIITAPTIDAEPVRHGEWVPKITEYGTMVFRCSACQRYSDIHWAYCPHCGTIMDGERKENRKIN